MSADYCLNKCPAYTPAGFDRALLDAWIEAIAYLPKVKPVESPPIIAEKQVVPSDF